MRRFLAIYFPNWAVDLTYIRRKNLVGPLALVRDGEHPQVMRVCRRAEGLGVAPGIPLSLAKIILPELLVAPFLAERDFQSLVSVGFWALKKLSPLVGVDVELLNAFRNGVGASVGAEHYGLLLDMTGTTRLHKDENRVIHQILMEFAAAGIEARVGIAPTVGMAWGLARYGTSAVKPATVIWQIEYEALSLPIRALRLEEETVLELEQLGFKTVKKLLNISQTDLAKRFGSQLVRRIDQFTGRSLEVFPTLHERRPYVVSKRFEYPLSAKEVLKDVVYEIFDALFTMLSGAGREANSFVLTIEVRGPDGGICYKQKELLFHKAPSSRGDLAAVVATALETFVIPGDVTGIRVEAAEHSATKVENAVLPMLVKNDRIEARGAIVGGGESRRGIDELLNHFVIRLGRERVRGMELQDSFIPERSFKLSPIGKIKSDSRASYVLKDRPSYLFAVPEQVQVITLLPDHSPSMMIWKGKRLRLSSGVGPERILNEWWKEADSRCALLGRDYFKVQDNSGRWLWLYRDLSSLEWFVHGIWT